MSVVLRPAIQPSCIPELTLVAATALCEVLQEMGCASATIKWPNDILISGKKAAGILTELSANPGQPRFVIVGVGIDVNMVEDDFPPELRSVATSMRMATGEQYSRIELVARLLSRFERWLDRQAEDGFPRVRQRWMKLSSMIGASVRVDLEKRRIEGIAEGIDDSGFLLVRSQYGVIERVVAGDVQMLRVENSSKTESMEGL